MNLIDIKNRLTKIKSEKDSLLGQKKIYIDQLKEASGVSSIELANKKVHSLNLKIKQAEKIYNEKEEEFKEKYEHLLYH